jgi:RimJ/RimL family protein N-acetyltransferase
LTDLIFGQDEPIADFVGRTLGITVHPPYSAIGFARNNELIGGAVFNEFNGWNIEVTLVCPMFSRGTIRALVKYAFIQAGCGRMTAKTRRSNKRTCQILPKIGFKFEGIQARFFGPQTADDAILFRLDRDVALTRWLKIDER